MPTSLTRSFLMLATVATSSCCSTILLLHETLLDLLEILQVRYFCWVYSDCRFGKLNEWGNPRNENYE